MIMLKMKEADIRHISSFVRTTLSPARYRHTMAVARLARTLARLHGFSPERAYVAGLLHDLAKEWPAAKLLRYARRYLHLPDPEAFTRSPHLLHAYVSAELARREWGIKERQILDAVRSHTLGALNMHPMEKILYVADASSPDRRFGEARWIRKKAKRNLEEAFRSAVAMKIRHIIQMRRPVHPLSVRVWNGLVK